MAESLKPGQSESARREMEKSPQDSCVGSIPFDYRYAGDGGLAPDTGSDNSWTDLKEEPELLFEEAPVKETNNNVNAVDLNDATPIPDCKGLLNRKSVYETALKLINEQFPNERRFTRVSQLFIDKLELVVQQELVKAIKRHPSPSHLRTIRYF
jgi:hypothetical protein